MNQSTMQLTEDQKRLICEALESQARELDEAAALRGGNELARLCLSHAEACRELRELLQAADEVTV